MKREMFRKGNVEEEDSKRERETRAVLFSAGAERHS